MSLTRRQKWRLEKIQAERIARANKVADNSQDLNTDAKAQTGLVITRYGQHLLVESNSGNLVQCTARRNIDLSVAGDQVIFQATDNNKGIVTALFKRDNTLKRSKKLIATNIDELCLIVAIEPHYQFDLIDRYLIVAENQNLPIRLIVNKIELSSNIKQVKIDFAMYEAIGYPVSYLSVKAQTGINTLKAQLNDKTQIFLGQSGVGKSSLINELIPELNLRVNQISTKSKLGKHTTTNTTLYHIPSGGDLIDSPGVREFHLDNLSNKEILNGFKEFKPFINQCKFRNCAHINEPNCGVKNALETDDIHPKRYASYLALIT
ncbi:Ribosome small subunit biogenesis RbfA-release protein RsgA [uncultured Gammaproteobacteria bacterium]|uniref:Small ribosomal subunit biogenesis GTPase RsgA n=3 Tax=sulfur-oxidizing symbionts TaxID=32036 RepID=A0A1H6LBF1_9GAMM|nr:MULTISPECIES: ribosome small subunit-dependent GTPase A [sulfur-oxidizing symbionts]CAC9496772.1 Ribosome small subunit biogenesis RbfA-release protein RsgA [uncultured Gammaproteobacteria bacterium]CAB5501223.1 Ribosome small subunit biogenesis RbfA-release protein RsgA [Bathymodiolus thermophilus thioautotrophic gill symbiont]CAB5505550.1 Ribosome small subunit biogenesis RbfA-release protein RsgA [Bathymodiolus azoricus thioautotrophic gill symbiont]CAC9528162.1 Ribosome small subunit bio